MLPGITRALCLELLPGLGVPVEEAPLVLDELAQAHGVLLTTSVRGLVPAIELDGKPPSASTATCSRRSPWRSPRPSSPRCGRCHYPDRMAVAVRARSVS